MFNGKRRANKGKYNIEVNSKVELVIEGHCANECIKHGNNKCPLYCSQSNWMSDQDLSPTVAQIYNRFILTHWTRLSPNTQKGWLESISKCFDTCCKCNWPFLNRLWSICWTFQLYIVGQVSREKKCSVSKEDEDFCWHLIINKPHSLYSIFNFQLESSDSEASWRFIGNRMQNVLLVGILKLHWVKTDY